MDPDLPGSDPADSASPRSEADGPVPAAASPAATPAAATPVARLEAALAALEAALEAQQRRADGRLAGLRRELDDMKAENARLAALLKAEQTRVQRLEDLTSAVSGRVDSAIGELESILEP